MNDKSLLFMTLSLCSIWVILDNIYGNKYLDNFLSNIFDFYDSDTQTTQQKNQTKWADAYISEKDGNPYNELTEEEKKELDKLKNMPKMSW